MVKCIQILPVVPDMDDEFETVDKFHILAKFSKNVECLELELSHEYNKLSTLLDISIQFEMLQT
jgi:hypothetical protein